MVKILNFIILLLILALFAYSIIFIFYAVRYGQSVSYATVNEIKCTDSDCIKNVQEDFTISPLQKDNEYSKDVCKFCAQLILRVEHPKRYTTIFPEAITKTMSITHKFNKSPVFCQLFRDKKKDVCWIAIRGTYSYSEIIADVDYSQVKFKKDNMKVHRGFYNIYKTIINEILNEIEKVKFCKIILTGHSLGAAVCTMIAYDLFEKQHDYIVYNFGSPRVGNPEFCNAINKYCHVYSLVNQADVVTNMPPSVSANFKNKQNLFFYNNCGKQIIFDDNWFSLANNHRISIYIDNI